MDKKRLDYYKKKLVARREELMKTIARTEEEGRQADDDQTVDLADKAANSYTKEFLFGMTNTDRTILNMIDAALNRINRGPTRVLTELPVRVLYMVIQLSFALLDRIFFDPREVLGHMVVARKVAGAPRS